jgi:hypothetical protein
MIGTSSSREGIREVEVGDRRSRSQRGEGGSRAAGFSAADHTEAGLAIRPGLICEHLAEELLEACFRSLAAVAVRIDVPDGHPHGEVLRPSGRVVVDLGTPAEDSSCLVCCPLQVDQVLGRARIDVDDVLTVDPELRGDLDDTVPVRIVRCVAWHDQRASEVDV